MAKTFLSGLFGKKHRSDPPADSPLNAENTSDTEHVEEAETSQTALALDQPERKGLFARLREGLSKSSARLSGGVLEIFTKRKLDEETLEEIEDLLVSADLGLPAAKLVSASLRKDRFDKEISDADLRRAIAHAVAHTLRPLEAPLAIYANDAPTVILMIGVNGAGKTTTIGKLAAQFEAGGFSVMIAAGDTFRAAAIDQLKVWGERAGAEVLARPEGADAAGLAYDALKSARDKQCDVLLIDTAGRLHNRRELMDELGKIVRVLRKLDASAPHHVVLVLDATVGQNALSQAAAFQEVAGVTGVIMTKLDGTAKGGVLVALGERMKLPIHAIGVGEGIEDLQPFRADEFAAALAGFAVTDKRTDLEGRISR